MRKLKSISIILVVMIASILAGCTTKPTNVVNNYLDDVKSKGIDITSIIEESSDEDTLKELNSDRLSNEYTDEVYEKLGDKLKDLKYKVNSENIDGDTATVNVTVTGPDFNNVIKEVIKEAFSYILGQAFSGKQMTEEETNKYVIDLFTKHIDEAESSERTKDIKLKKVDNKWQITYDEDLLTLLTGINSDSFDDLNQK